jgi:hypothetical protein
MTPHPLNSSFERVIRAGEHLTDLRKRLTNVVRQQEDSVIVEFDPDPPHDLNLIPLSETFVTMRIGVLIGEICYNLRSAIDYLVFELSKLDSGGLQAGTQFPIVDTERVFTERARTWLKGINPAHVAAIERLQPYNQCDWTKTLRDLSNRDKHREFASIKGDYVAIGYPLGHSNFDFIRGSIRHALHPIRGETEVRVHFTGRIQFPDGSPILESLQIVKLNVAKTLNVFKADF